MKDIVKNGISFSGEFADRALEKEFLNNDMKYYSRLIGPIALIFGIIYMLFIIADYFAIKDSYSFMIILIFRLLFLMASVSIYFYIRKINDYSNMVYLISIYEVWAVISFMVIIYQYGSIGFIALFSVVAITMALYITPNKLINAQIISILFNLSFFILFAKHIEDIESGMLMKIAAYDLIFLIMCNIEACLVNFYRRRQFVYSRELLRLSVTDSLTGVYNRARFDQELKWSVDYCNRYAEPLSLVMFDIDDFKKVNDCYGHLIGDNVLQNITSTIKKTIRSTDIFARWGGEEFVIILPNTDIHQAMEMTERMRSLIQKNKYKTAENVTCSFGLVSLQKNEDAESLLKRVDKLLYRAKNQGKNSISCEADEAPEQTGTGTYMGSFF